MTIRPQPPLGHRRRRRAHQPHRRHHVQLPLRLPVLVGQLVERADGARAGVVDQHVDPPEAAQARAREALAGIGGGDVERERLGAPAGRRHRPGGLGQRLLASRPTSSTRGPLARRATTAVARPIPREAPVTTHARSQAEIHAPDSPDGQSRAPGRSSRDAALDRRRRDRLRVSRARAPGGRRRAGGCHASPSTPTPRAAAALTSAGLVDAVRQQHEHEQARGDPARPRLRAASATSARAALAAARGSAGASAADGGRARRGAMKSASASCSSTASRRRRAPCS